MKRLNNKGFAITTIVYGLAIMSTMILTLVMSLLATTRQDNNNLSKAIEDELNRFSKTSVLYAPASIGQEFIVPEGQAGWYRIELWGAQGGGNNGGLGAYTSGIIKLNEGDMLYFVVGQQGTSSTGGGSTDVRIENTDSTSSEETRIMVAAGGGVQPGSAGGTLVGYNSNMLASGGQIQIKDGYGLKPSTTLLGYTITSGVTSFPTSTVTQTGTPKESPDGSNVGGEGYFTSSNQNFGGVSFISGYAGSKAYVQGSLRENAKYVYHKKTGGTYEATGKEYYFVDGYMLPGVKAGAGQARIERIASSDSIVALPRQNPKLNEVQRVRDCISTTSNSPNIRKIAVSVEGQTITGTLSTTTSGTKKCAELNLGGTYNVDEVVTFHDPGYDYIENTVEVYTSSGWKTIKGVGNGYNISETETPTGVRISAYQPDYTENVPTSGNYYLFPVTAEGKVVSGHALSADRANPLEINSLEGEVRQKWSIEKLNEKIEKPGIVEYKIVELTRYNALTIYKDENMEGNQLIVSSFNNLARNEPSIWKVTPMGDGTVTITSSAPTFTSFKETGNIYVQTNSTIVDNYNTLVIGINNNVTQRFKLVKLDY